MLREEIVEIVEEYEPQDLSIATLCSHSSLQIFHGAKKEGFRTIGIAVRRIPSYYSLFPLGSPDEFMVIENMNQIQTIVEELQRKNTIIVPHGSFVEYLGWKNALTLKLPFFGNVKVLEWESDREKERDWFERANIKYPRIFAHGKEIDAPAIVKSHGAGGGRGYHVIMPGDSTEGMEGKLIQEYICLLYTSPSPRD